MDLTNKNFDLAVSLINSLNKKPNDEELLILYGLYKQSTKGDINIDKPGIFDIKGNKKWDAWNSRKGLSKTEAMMGYTKYALNLVERYK